jgi:hypothetical protein
LDPKLERVRSKLRGGSFTTIYRVLTTVLLSQRQTHATPDQRAVAAIYAAVQRQAGGQDRTHRTEFTQAN